jgi:hypothetical protein
LCGKAGRPPAANRFCKAFWGFRFLFAGTKVIFYEISAKGAPFCCLFVTCYVILSKKIVISIATFGQASETVPPAAPVKERMILL